MYDWLLTEELWMTIVFAIEIVKQWCMAKAWILTEALQMTIAFAIGIFGSLLQNF